MAVVAERLKVYGVVIAVIMVDMMDNKLAEKFRDEPTSRADTP